jgi:hypothetical protein
MARCYTLSALEAQRLEEEGGWPYDRLYHDIVEYAYVRNMREPIVVETPDHQIVFALGADLSLEAHR